MAASDRRALAILAGAAIGVLGGVFALLVVMAGPVMAFGALIGLAAALYVLTSLHSALYAMFAVIALLPFANLPVDLGVTPTLLDGALGAFMLVYLMQWTSGQRRLLRSTPLTPVVLLFIGIMLFAFLMGLRHAPLTARVLRNVLEMVLSLLLIRFITRRSQPYFIQQQVSLGELNGHVEEMFAGHIVIKAFGAERKSVEAFRTINSTLYGSAWRSQFFSGLMFPVMMFVGNLGYVGVAVLGGWLAIQGRLRIGDIQAFLQYLNQFTQPITQTASIANVMQSTAAAAERVFEFLDEAEETPDPVTPIEPGVVEGAVDFDHVVFGYLPGQTIIKDFSTNVQPGQRVAIVGPTGAGKTTVVNLLMRFYDPDAGTIRIDTHPTVKMTRADVRRQFGMVLQESWLFNGTIAENIAYGRKDATGEEIRAAAMAAHADHFIRALPGGYDMELNEDADNISAGEKQLLTIARAILADAPMLIFDEATSSVDTRTEALIQEAMTTMMQGRTSFVIAHRLSTIRNADLILVMVDGNVVEQGTHDELMAQHGFYAGLYLSQFTAPEELEVRS